MRIILNIIKYVKLPLPLLERVKLLKLHNGIKYDLKKNCNRLMIIVSLTFCAHKHTGYITAYYSILLFSTFLARSREITDDTFPLGSAHFGLAHDFYGQI